ARAAFPPARNLGPGRHVRRHLADGSMQRIRAQPRAIRAAAVQPKNRRGVRCAADGLHQRASAEGDGATGKVRRWHLADSGPHAPSRLKFANKQTSANATGPTQGLSTRLRGYYV